MEILIIFLLITLLQKPSNNLYCGLFAWIGDSNKKFNWDKFNILGIYNDTRGGDSCGRVSGDTIEYGLGKKSNYGDFIIHHQNFPVRERVIIGHDRKASIGYAVNEDNAQPIVLKEDGEIVFVLAHNGTILNIDDLKKKYKIDANYSKSDSYILAKIIYEYGFDVLSEYRGSAALIMYDRKQYLKTGDTLIHVFKGASKLLSTSKDVSEERPLFLMVKNNSTYFSSVEEALYSIGGTFDNILDIDTNVVLTFENGLYNPDLNYPIDRKDSGQFKEYKQPYYPRSRYNEYDDWEGGYGDNYSPFFGKSTFNIEGEELIRSLNTVEYKRGLYHLRGAPMNGIYHLDKSGVNNIIPNESTQPFYFLHGVMISDHAEYNVACRLIKSVTNLKVGSKEFNKVLLKSSVYPLLINTGDPAGSCFYYVNNANQRLLFDGTLKTVFAAYEYNVEKGVVKERKYIYDAERPIPKVFEKPIKEENDLDMIEQEAATIMGEVLTAISEARSNLTALGDESKMVKTLLENLDTIEDTLFIDGKGSLYKSKLNLSVEWKEQF